MSDRPSQKPVAMTAFAQAALATSDLVNAAFRDQRFSGNVLRQVKVQTPQVESTQGGKQARESIMLVAVSDETAPPIACGFLDVGLRSCEVRGFDALSFVFEQRTRQRLDIPRSEYEDFLRRLRTMLENEGYVFKTVEEQEQLKKAEPGPAKKKNATAAVVALGIIAALVIVGVVVILAR